MNPPSRKRFNAFDDFPGEINPESGAGPKIPPPAAAETAVRSTVERIERLKPSQMLPDRFQPRRLLPAPLREPFFSGQLDCYRAAAEWISLARTDSTYRAEIDRLLSMGESFESHGQIKPITGTWAPAQDGSFIFLIETGERRFWAASLRYVHEHLTEEPLLRVEVVNTPTRQRQVLENRHAEPPSSVGQACEVASLVLAELRLDPPSHPGDEYDYFRQARNQRMPAGLWDKVTPVMQLTRPRMVQLLNILLLPTPLLELADRHRLPERTLREILTLPERTWEQQILTAIQQRTAENGESETENTPARPAAAPRPTPPPPETSRTALVGLRRFANALAQLDELGQAQALDDIADQLVVSGQSEALLNLLGELSRLVSARVTRRYSEGKAKKV